MGASSEEDAALLHRWQGGETEAGEALVRRHYDRVYGFFAGKVPPDVCADLAQATFAVLCEGTDRFRGESSVRSYLLGIARWQLVGHFRKKGRQVQRFTALDSQAGDDGPSLESNVQQKREQALVVHALRSLSWDDQILLELKEYENIPERELATIYEVSRGTIRGRIVAARQRLQQAVERLVQDTALPDTITTLCTYFRSVREQAERP